MKNIPQFIHLPTEGHLSGLQCLVIIINAAINTYIQVSVWTYVFISLGKITKRRTAGHLVNIHLTLFKKKAPLSFLTKWPDHFVFPPAMQGRSSCSAPLSTLDVVRYLLLVMVIGIREHLVILMIMLNKHLFMCLFVILYLPW